MVQKMLSRLCFMLVTMAGLFLLASIFILPYYAEAIFDIADGRAKIPHSLQAVFNFSQYATHHKPAIAIAYGIVFLTVVVWSIKARRS